MRQRTSYTNLPLPLTFGRTFPVMAALRRMRVNLVRLGR